MIFERYPWLEAIRPRIEAIAATDSDVLIRGARLECEIVARAIHAVSGLPRRSFTGVSCGLYSPRALESTLLGSVPKSGLLYWDEIDEMPLALQARFLQILREHRPSRAEGRAPWPFRVIAATNRDLEELVLRGEFVEELYRPLEAEEITIPPNTEIPKAPRDPRCGKIARTSRARQCRWCHHDWHDQPPAET